MENFSTLRRQILPWAANVATLAVMVAVTWWSSDQRPTQPVQEAAVVSPPEEASPPVRQPVVAPATGATQAMWPAQTTLLKVESLRPVSFGALAQR